MRRLLGIILLALSHEVVLAQQFLDGEPLIAYWQVGVTSTDRVIIVVHGGPAVGHDYLRPEWDRLSSLGRVVFYDQRGCGLSGTAASYTWQDHVADLRRVIVAVSPDRPVVLAGSSWGSLLARLYVLDHPSDVEGLVLSGLPEVPVPSGGAARLLPELNINIPPPLDILRVPEAPRFPSLFRPRPMNPAEADERRRRVLALLEPRIVADCPDVRAATNASLEDAPIGYRFDIASLPTLLFPDNRFERDFSAAAASPEIERRTWKIVDGGHDPWFEHPDEFFDVVSRFLRRLWS